MFEEKKQICRNQHIQKNFTVSLFLDFFRHTAKHKRTLNQKKMDSTTTLLILQNIINLLNFTSYVFRNQNWLRIFSIIASTMQIIWSDFALTDGARITSIAWNSAVVAINLFQLSYSYYRKRNSLQSVLNG